MCVAAGDSRAELFSRGAFLAVAAAVAAPVAAGTSALAQEAPVERHPLPPVPASLSRGNARAAAFARRSPVAQATYARVEALARSIADARARDSLVALLHDPRPQYARRFPTAAQRTAVRDALARAGFVPAGAPVAGIFPSGTEGNATHGVQPFWSAPGSGEGSHHAFPGGLAMHEYFNASMADAYARRYDRAYFNGADTIDRDTVVAAALYHDIMKTVVFQWNDDGTLFDELTIAGTGAHHILSGAEAIARGRSPRFVTTLLSAHAAPSLGDELKVAAWCRASAIVAGVDPVEYGLVRADGTLVADPAPVEAFISYLSDHDYVLSVHAMHVVGARLQARYATLPPMPGGETPTFAWYRNAVLTRTTALALYDALTRRGEGAFDEALRSAEGDV